MRGVPLALALASACSRRVAIGTAATSLFAPPIASAAEPASLPPGAIMLRVAEVTDYQEKMLRQLATMDEAELERGGFVIERSQMAMSTDILLKNTRLSSLPGCVPAALTLASIKQIAQDGKGALTPAEEAKMALAYFKAREQLRLAFEALPAAEQADAKAIVRKLRAEDLARIREGEREMELEQQQRALYGERR